MRIRTHSEKETAAFAKKFARTLKGGEVILLQGELGAGKTTFVRGLARAFGIRGRITSPTFVLMHVHKSHRQDSRTSKQQVVQHLVHVDAYRVKSAHELRDIGLMDWLGRPDTLVVVEWGEKIKPLLKGKTHLVIKFQHGENRSERVIITPPHLPLS